MSHDFVCSIPQQISSSFASLTDLLHRRSSGVAYGETSNALNPAYADPTDARPR